jgi:YesN/AraC family two-component response regulator
MAVPFRPHLLVVDDEACIREALTAALGATYVVHAAASGGEACALLTAHPIAGLILDVQLGDEHGLDLIPRFRTLSDAPILVLTGHSTEDLAIQAVDAQVAKYLKKPINLAELLVAIHRLVPQTDSATDLAERARHYLDAHLATHLRVADLARQLGASAMHLHRCFRAVTGKTPGRYLTEVRMQYAARLLRTTPLGIERIATATGYPSSTSFGRLFRRWFGMAPLAYRTTALKETH